jgi:hypothetical protein
MDAEWAAYAPGARETVAAFTAGVNAYAAEVRAGARPRPRPRLRHPRHPLKFGQLGDVHVNRPMIGAYTEGVAR